MTTTQTETAPAQPESPSTVRLVLRSMRRHWLAILVSTILGGLAGFGLWVALSGTSSTATVFVSALDANPYSPDPRGQSLTNMETEAQLARSDVVMDQAAAKLGEAVQPSDVKSVLVVSIPAGSQVLAIKCRSMGDVEPKECANAVAMAYLATRQQKATDSIASRRKEIDKAKVEAQKQLDAAAKDLATSKAGSATNLEAEQSLVIASSSLASLAAQDAELATKSTDPGEIMSQGAASGLGKPLAQVLIGALIGFVLSLGWGFRKDHWAPEQPAS